LDLLKPVVILDAGFASKANIGMLKKRGYSYLINITRGSRTKYAECFAKEVFEALPGRKPELKVEVKKITDPEDEESQLLLCRSAQRRLKEEAMLSKAEIRFLKDAHSLRERIEKGRLKTPEVIERKIGSLLKKHPRVRRFYKVKHENGGLVIERNDEKMEEARDLCGDYVLKTDKGLGAAELWGLYMTLLKAEAGFKMLKGSLGLRPNFHQLEDRVDGHIFISVLAYHLLSWVHHNLERNGDTREWKTVRRLLSTHCLVSTRLQLEDGRIITIRKPSVPDAEQARVFKKLGIDWKAMCPPVKTEKK
jgi:transposase